ncbi:GNAT family N-acetyltransferase [Falsiroseomonas sp. CW058]|uniref:GNAT family N-acetyltransferase n=1 Tax=Falsiroseomonas sp. CW058 TaxID=3388664 RepID=UPI003D3145D1
MAAETTLLPAGLRLDLTEAPPAELRAALLEGILAFHDRTVPLDRRRFALRVEDAAGVLVAGLAATLSWQWMFVEAVWVAEDRRGQGLGRVMLARAEAEARARGCHSAWLDTFQARAFYLAQGYEEFGALTDYPPGQVRSFLRKRLA